MTAAVIELSVARSARVSRAQRLFTEQDLNNARADGYVEGVNETVIRFLEVSTSCTCSAGRGWAS